MNKNGLFSLIHEVYSCINRGKWREDGKNGGDEGKMERRRGKWGEMKERW